MRKLDKIEIVCLVFLLLCVIGFRGNDSNFWNSFYYIREHGFIIALLLLFKQYFNSIFSILLAWGIIIYKSELIVFNVILIFLDKNLYHYCIKSYDIVMGLSASIFVIIFTARFFDKIVITAEKLIRLFKSKWIKR